MDINIAMIILAMLCSIPKMESWRQEYIGGSYAKKGQFPWHAVLSTKPNDDAICSGSLVSDVHIVSVKSCLLGVETIYLRLGGLTLYDPDALLLESSTFIEHNEASIVLIVVAKPIKFIDGIRPIRLSKANSDVLSRDIRYRVSGYGLVWQPRPSLKNEEKTYRLKYGNIIPVTRLDVCTGERNAYKMCAKGSRRQTQGICGGDKGSAVIGKNEWGTRSQIAIQMKYSWFCKFDESALTYILLDKLLPWFAEHLKIPINIHQGPENSDDYDDQLYDYFINTEKD